MNKSFSEQFSDAWSKPDPDRLVSLLHNDVVLYQPHRRVIKGKREAYNEFTSLLATFPGIHGVVDRWLEADNVAFIEWRLMIPTNSKMIEIPMVDRFFIVDGLGIERKVYFDQWELAKAALLNPRLMPGLIRYSIL